MRESHKQLVRFGVMGQVRPFRGEGIAFSRGSEVVVRTGRGLEWGTVLTAPAPLEAPSDGTILRSLSGNDRLLIERIEKNKLQAIDACEQKLRESTAGATLVDLELLFDGQTLVFYFLGEIDAEIERITAELAEVFETKVQFRRFTATVLEGCGPDCGTASASGSCTDCTSCAVATACGKTTST
ncbi:MAG: PSP1 C-terminal domain-containing protein [Pirellulales bacterium]|nr:PSP1 C-terminal domain-containing protein [Pirellulales bacterium]